MSDLEILSLAIGLTCGGGLLLQKVIIPRGWLPVACALCSHIVLECHSINVQLTLGTWHRICDACFTKKYGHTIEEELHGNHDNWS